MVNVHVVVVNKVVGHKGVDDNQSGSPERSGAAGKVHAAVVDKVVGRVGVDDDQSGPLEAIRLVIMNSLKTRTSWWRLKGKKSLKQSEAAEVVNIQVVVIDEVVGRVGVDDDQSGSLERGDAADEVLAVVAEEVIGLAEVDDEPFGFPENSILDLGRQLLHSRKGNSNE